MLEANIGPNRLTHVLTVSWDVDAALEGEILDVAQRQREADVQHHHQLDHLGELSNQRNGSCALDLRAMHPA